SGPCPDGPERTIVFRSVHKTKAQVSKPIAPEKMTGFFHARNGAGFNVPIDLAATHGGDSMPYATADDGVSLFYEEVGAGRPVIFLHEFAGDYRSWEAQLRHFGRRYRCIA